MPFSIYDLRLAIYARLGKKDGHAPGFAGATFHPSSVSARAFFVALCFSAALLSGRADDWPQWMGPQRDGVWRETGIVEKLPTNGLTYRWRVPLGSGYSGPAVVGQRVFVMDRQVATGAKAPANAFTRAEISGNERVVCLSETDGRLLWKHEYD